MTMIRPRRFALTLTIVLLTARAALAQAPSTTTLVMSGVSPALTFTATVTSTTVPTGIVMFKDNGTNQGTFPLSATGTAAWVVTLGTGAHLVTAEYGGSALVAASVSTGTTITVGAPPPPRILITATSVLAWDQVAPDLATAQSYVYSGYVDTVKGPALSTTCAGTTAYVCSAPVPVAALVIGDHALEVTTTGGGIETAKTNTVLVTVAAPALIVTSTSLVMTGTPTTASFTATVTSATGTPSGAIVFKDNGVTRRTTTLSATGTAVWGPLTTLALGAHVITAEYAGSATMSASVSPGLTTTVTITAPTGLRVTP